MPGLLSNFSQPGGLLAGNNFQEKFMNFLQSPQALALAAGLLESGQPSFTTPPSLAGGLASGFANVGKENRFMSEQQLEREKLKQQELLEKARLAIMQGSLDIDRSKLGLEREKAAQSLEEKQYRRQLMENILNGGMDSAAGATSPTTPDQRKRAATMAAAGYVDEAFKILTEKAEKDPTQSATTATISAAQEQLRSIDAAIPSLERLKTLDQPDIPPVPGGGIYSSVMNPTRSSVAKKAIKDVAKDYLASKQTRITDASIDAAVDVLSKAPGETQQAYIQRIDQIIKDLKEKGSYASSVVKPVRPVKGSESEIQTNNVDNDPLGIRKK